MPPKTRAFSELELLRFVSSHAHGVTSADVEREFGCDREAVRRGLKKMAESHVGVRRSKGIGGARDWYIADRQGRLSAEQRWAVAIVRDVLGALNGSRLVATLDAIIDDVPELAIEVDGGVAIEDPAVVAVVYEAMIHGQRLHVDYAGLKDTKPRRRFVEVHHLKQVAGAWYATVSDLDDGAKTKTFKVARMSKPTLTTKKRAHSAAVDAIYAHSVGVWDGPLIDVAIRVDGRSAKHACEYKLNITQRERWVADDAVEVRATVAGLDETLRWIWRWGAAAQALSPPELVERCAQALRAAAQRYS